MGSWTSYPNLAAWRASVNCSWKLVCFASHRRPLAVAFGRLLLVVGISPHLPAVAGPPRASDLLACPGPTLGLVRILN